MWANIGKSCTLWYTLNTYTYWDYIDTFWYTLYTLGTIVYIAYFGILCILFYTLHTFLYFACFDILWYTLQTLVYFANSGILCWAYICFGVHRKLLYTLVGLYALVNIVKFHIIWPVLVFFCILLYTLHTLVYFDILWIPLHNLVYFVILDALVECVCALGHFRQM